MYTKSYPVYDFDELKPEAQERALKDLYDCNVDFDDWHEPVLEGAKEDLSALGYDDAEIGYRGFWSQGDGAHFTASVDVLKWIKTHKAGKDLRLLASYVKQGNYINAGIKRNSSHYEHEYTISGEVELDSGAIDDDQKYNRLEEQAQRLENMLIEDARNLSRKIYRDLEKYYEELTTKEAITETIKANEWTFTASGKLDNL